MKYQAPRRIPPPHDLTALAEVGYDGSAVISKPQYPEQEATLTFEGSAGDRGDSLAGYDYPALRDLRCRSALLCQFASASEPWGIRGLRRGDLTPASGGTHDTLYGYDNQAGWRPGEMDKSEGFARRARPLGSGRVNLSQVKSADIGTLNANKDGMTGSPEWEEDFGYDPTGNCRARRDLRLRLIGKADLEVAGGKVHMQHEAALKFPDPKQRGKDVKFLHLIHAHILDSIEFESGRLLPLSKSVGEESPLSDHGDIPWARQEGKGITAVNETTVSRLKAGATEPETLPR